MTTARKAGEFIGAIIGTFFKGWVFGAGLVLGALNMWGYIGGVNP